jgi:hypothetical protein
MKIEEKRVQMDEDEVNYNRILIYIPYINILKIKIIDFGGGVN